MPKVKRFGKRADRQFLKSMNISINSGQIISPKLGIDIPKKYRETKGNRKELKD